MWATLYALSWKEAKVDSSKSLMKGKIFFRYGRLDDESAGVIEEELFVMGRGKQTTVEMVGAKSVNIKQRFVCPEYG